MRRFWWVAFGAAVVVQVLTLYLPQVSVPGSSTPSLDKIWHATIFAAVMVAGAQVGIRRGPLASILIAHAVVSELIQHYLLPDRTGDWLDVAADITGVLLGWLCLASVRPMKSDLAGDIAVAEPGARAEIAAAAAARAGTPAEPSTPPEAEPITPTSPTPEAPVGEPAPTEPAAQD